MQSWKAGILHAGRRWFFAALFIAATLLFLAAACGSLPRPTPTVRRLEEWCSDENRWAVMQVSAPTVPVLDLPGCTAQLQVLPDKTQYGHDDPVTIIARFSVQGDCELYIISTYNFNQFAPIRFFHQSGETVSVTQEWQEMMDKANSGLTHKVGFTLTAEEEICYQLPMDRWYDLAAPGTYTLTLAYRGATEMYAVGGVAGNTVTFTRRP